MKKIPQRVSTVKASRDKMFNKNISIFAGWLIDGSGAAAQHNLRLDLEDSIIQTVSKMTSQDPDLKKLNQPVLDLAGCTLLPGLFDCHVHLAMSAAGDRKALNPPAAHRSDRVRTRIIKHLNQYLAKGILAVRDGGDPSRSALLYKANPCAGDPPMHVSVAGTAWHRPGHYGGLIGSGLPSERTLAEAILEEKENVDHIKIVNSGLNSLTCFGKETEAQFDSTELKAAIMAAHRRGLKTMVHANGKIPVKYAVDAGCDSIEHGYFMGEENLRRMAGRGTTWVPTAFTMKALGRRMMDHGSALNVWQKNLEHQIGQMKIARDLGVRIALGTDAGSAGVEHGHAMIAEMQLLMEAGYSVEEAIQCASLNGAKLLGLPRLGQVKKNWQATLIAVKGDPSQLPESLNNIKVIIYKGKQIDINIK